MRRPAALAALAFLAGCGDQAPLTISVGDRLIYSEAQAAPVAVPGAVPGAAPAPGAPAVASAATPFRMPTITSNVPVFIGDRQIGGPGAPAAP